MVDQRANEARVSGNFAGRDDLQPVSNQQDEPEYDVESELDAAEPLTIEALRKVECDADRSRSASDFGDTQGREIGEDSARRDDARALRVRRRESAGGSCWADRPCRD
jgi:hypothetical protein